jgi:tRNA pseudouridine13 synthase
MWISIGCVVIRGTFAHLTPTKSLREYSLPGSYRRIINLPTRVDWAHLSYTDPDIALTQSDEDKLLDYPPPATHDPDGKFKALRIELELGSSAYATMALREVTREETSVWHQIGLTLGGEDQGFKGVGEVKDDGEGEEEEAVVVDEAEV